MEIFCPERFWKMVGASSAEWRNHSWTSPCSVLVPALVETFTVLPMVWPSEASNAEVCTLNSLMASWTAARRRRGRGAIGKRVGDAVDGEFVLVVAAAIGRERGRRVVEAGFAEPQVGAVDGAGGKMDQIHGVAGELRQLENAAFVDYLAEGGFRGGEQGRGGADLDRLGGGADLKFDIDLNAVVDADLDARRIDIS